MPKFTIFNRLSIFQRIAGGFAVVLLLCSILAFASVQGMHVIERNVANSRATFTAALVAEGFASSLTELNYKVTRYALTGTIDDRETARLQLATVSESLGRVANTAGQDTRAVAKPGDAFAQYQAATEETFKAVSVRFAAAEELKKTGIALANMVSAINARLVQNKLDEVLPIGLRLQESMQASLVAATRYLSSQNPADADAAKSSLGKLREATMALAVAAGDNAKLQRFAEATPQLIAEYEDAIGKLIHGTDMFIDATKNREEAGHGLVGIASELKRTNIEAEDAAVHSVVKTLKSVTDTNVLLSIAVLLAGAALAYLLSRSIARPIAAMTHIMKSLASGDLAIAVAQMARRDEIGDMARAVEIFKENAVAVRRLEEEQKEIERRSAAEHHAEMVRLADAFDATVSAVVDTVSSASTELRAEAEQMSATAEVATAKADAVAAASGRASHNVDTVATATEELTTSFNEIAGQVTEASQVAKDARIEAQRTNASIQGLAENAHKIDGVIALIQGIAKQTNLLALNATIEAARAGEAGKGFAVVASEVKNLAGQTARATEEISEKIQNMQAASKGAVDAIAAIFGTIERIDGISSSIAGAVEEQQSASHEIARSVQEAARETSDVSVTIGGVTEAANATGSAASHVLSAARELSQQSARLRQEVDAFLSKVRAA